MIIEEITSPPDPAQAGAALSSQASPFLLGSGMQVGEFGRYSFAGCDPFCILQSKNGVVKVTGHRPMETTGDPFEILAELYARYRIDDGGDTELFAGGFVGYLGYDLCHHLETLPRTAEDDIGIPDILLGAYDAVYACDHDTGRGYILSTGLPDRGTAGRRRARNRAKWLREAICADPTPRTDQPATSDTGPSRTFGRDRYLQAVQRAIDYIYAGDIFQVNLSQRFDASLQISPWELYMRLHERNPAPFSAYLDFPDAQVVSASPERFIRGRGRELQTRPIKGTRPRGSTAKEDEKLKKELLNSRKDRAELTMIVDLERNDFGRVCEFGSVKVPDMFALETYPTVHHLVGTVTGRLREDKTYVDLLRASLPGGSITGAPKIRSMEIIDELEPTQRAVYTGCIGYLGFNQQMDLNIVIRTFIIANGRAYWQVGGGIVADSSPEAEYRETLDKGLALAETLGFDAIK